ncbi:DUF4139 domain-containing protein [Marinobacterium lutimaris]|uniref:DUF4139 domain-containing protein n=1 Tax=Marinobacterium lutimaris TaxID=568106 RepID=A0A1H6C9C0_9GAMM|nr:DUF4139 domain-containing protein [Marinobacterium lutimaris]SEG68966.1 hypothetical protein SAMN05444390_103257 [Marinobacterium lutimaris]
MYHPKRSACFNLAPLGLGLSIALLSQASLAAPDLVLGAQDRSSRTLTIYQQDLALFSETYPLSLDASAPEIRLNDISNRLQPDSIFTSGIGDLRRIELGSSNPGFSERLQALQGKEVELIHQDGATDPRTVTLLYVEGSGIQVADNGATEFIPYAGPWRIRIPGTSQPASGAHLSLQGSGQPGDQLTLSYLSNGISWQAGYQLEILPDGKRIQLEGRATLSNNSGTDLDGAQVRLLAGKVNQPNSGRVPIYAMAAKLETSADAAPQREATQDYQLYPLPEPVNLKQGASISVPLQAPIEMALSSHYRFEQSVYGGAQPQTQTGHPRHDISFTLPNDDANDLPLPAGSARVYRETQERGLTYVGGQQLSDTAAGEQVTLTLGEAFDLTVETEQTEFQRQGENVVVGFKVSIRNSGNEDRTLDYRAIFNQPRIMLASSERGEELGAIQAWTLDIPAGGEKVLEYSVRLLRN